MSDTPKTDLMVTGNSDPSPDEYEGLATFCRQLESTNADLLAACEAAVPFVEAWGSPVILADLNTAIARAKGQE